MKKHLLQPIGIEKAIILDIDTSNLSPRNARYKYTKRQWWLEKNKKGEYRSVYSTYDNKRKVWCNPKKGTYYPFLGLVITENSNITGDASITGFNYYTSVEDIKAWKEKYILSPEASKEVDTYIQMKEDATKLYEERKALLMKEIKEDKRPMTSYKFKHLYTKKEIANCSDPLNILDIAITCSKAIKKKCRKADYYTHTIGYVVLPPGYPDMNIDQKEAYKHYLLLDLESKAQIAVTSRLRKNETPIKLEAQEVEYTPSQGDSPFYSMKRNLSIGLMNKNTSRLLKDIRNV